MNKNWIYNPKLKGSGLIECIPQKGKCPHNCQDCFFQSGRSYLEPLDKNLPHIPSKEMAEGKIVRFNDGNDSNHQRTLVEKTAKQYDDYFFNTSIPYKLEEFSAPVVLTINPGTMTDKDYYELEEIPENLMFVRIRVNPANLGKVVVPAISYYSSREIPVILTFMAYYTVLIEEKYQDCYTWKKRTTNSYWALKDERIEKIMELFKFNPYVYQCGYKNTYSCKFCGHCIREYYNCKERLNNESN